MNILPIVEREMRVASRSWTTQLWKMLIGLSAMVATWMGFEETKYRLVGGGDEILVFLSFAALIFCGFAGAFLTADTISFEKREGTLGLLFLSNLSALEIVLGKLAAGAVRFLTCLLVVLPFMMIPLLKGGVTWPEILRSWLALLIAFFFSVSLGLLVSVFVIEARKGIMTTVVIILLHAFLPFIVRVFGMATRAWNGNGNENLLVSFTPIGGALLGINDFYGGGGFGRASYWIYIGFHSVMALLFLLVAASTLNRKWKRTGADFANTAAGEDREGKKTSKKMTKVQRGIGLEESPYGWMIFSRYRGMTVIVWMRRFLILLLVVTIVLSLLVSRDPEVFFVIAMITAGVLHFLTKLDMEMESVRQLHEDAKQGGLELIMSTPLPDKEILDGAVWSLRKTNARFLPSLLVANGLLAFSVVAFAKQLHMHRGDYVPFMVLFLGGVLMAVADFRTIPIIALHRAIRSKSLVAASFTSAALVHLVPWVFFFIGFAILSNSRGVGWEEVAVFFGGWSVVSIAWVLQMGSRARRILEDRFRGLVAGE